ncbi:MAG: cobyrinate a,c-diamide synthase [Pseudomonadota bacterium]
MAPQSTASCPALFFCAPASGQGKTTITAGIARYHRNQGRDVRVFKTGPDFLDPLILEQASGHPVAQLDLWMTGEAECQRQLYQAALEADLILIEGVMGMFDGDPSGADMAQYFGIPVGIIINAGSMAQTFAAIANGLVSHRPDLAIAGVIANKIGGVRHERLIRDAMEGFSPLLGCVRRTPEMALPERHLGLVQPQEIGDIDARLDRIAEVIESAGLTALPEPVEFSDASLPYTDRLLAGVTVALARDDAFSFIYAANTRLLEDMGATVLCFSPLKDESVPEADVLWLPGGYPELHMHTLTANTNTARSVRAFHDAGKAILAECGGMLYLMESLTAADGDKQDMLGILPGHGVMRERGGCQGMQYAPLPEGELRGHAHHRTRCEHTLEPIAYGRRAKHPAPGEAIYRQGNTTASYLHLYFPSNPAAVAELFRRQVAKEAA